MTINIYNKLANWINNTIFFFQWKCFLLFIISISLSTPLMAYYSDVYDQKLERLVQTTPDKSLRIATTNLKSAKNGNAELIALYYIAQSNNMLNRFTETKEIVRNGLLLAQQQKSERFIFEFTVFSIFEYEFNGEFIEALKIANQNYQRAIKLDDKRLIGISLTIRGQMYLNLGDQQSALKDVKDSLAIFQHNNDKPNISNSFNTLAIIYTDLNDFEKSIEFYKESLNSDIKSSYDNSTIYYNIGSTYLEMENYATALEYFNKTIESATQVNDTYLVAFAKNGIADTYLTQKEYSKAINMYTRTVNTFQEDNDVQMLFNINLSLAQAYIGKNEFEKAFKYLSIAQQYSQSLDSMISKINVLEIKKQLFRSQKKWQDAFHTLDRLTTLKNKLNKSNKENLIQELKIKYNAQFDQEKMELLQSKNNLKDSFILQQKIKNNYLSILIGLTAFLLITTLYAYGVQRRQRKHLVKLSTTDSLTDTYNRRYIVDYLKSLHSNNNDQVVAHSVVMIDLDYFKNINDSYGHEVGNKVLIYFTNIVNKHIENHGKIGRLGGEEWLIILENFKANDVAQLLTAIREDYKYTRPINIPKTCNLNFSSGVLLHAEYYQDYDQILKDVDKALYSAKHDGRGNDCIVNQES